jgi:hypothetical protein
MFYNKGHTTGLEYESFELAGRAQNLLRERLTWIVACYGKRIKPNGCLYESLHDNRDCCLYVRFRERSLVPRWRRGRRRWRWIIRQLKQLRLSDERHGRWAIFNSVFNDPEQK